MIAQQNDSSIVQSSKRLLADPVHCPSRVAGMTLRPELPEHAGRQIGILEIIQATNQKIKSMDPRVWFADIYRVLPVREVAHGRSDVEVLRASWKARYWGWGPEF